MKKIWNVFINYSSVILNSKCAKNIKNLQHKNTETVFQMAILMLQIYKS